MGSKNWSSQLNSLRAGLANPVYLQRYPLLAQLKPAVASPLLGANGCSEQRSCPPAPYNNQISHNAAVNSSWVDGMKAFGGHQLLAGAAVALPLETEFPSNRFALIKNGNKNGSASEVGLGSCWQLHVNSPLRAWLVDVPDTAKIGTPSWQRTLNCDAVANM